MKVELENVRPEDIEHRSMEIIESELPHPLDPEKAPIIKRVIHTTADFSFADSLVFSEGVVPYAKELLRKGAVICTDTTMAMAGISKPTLAKYGGEVHCFVADEDVRAAAKAHGTTRSTEAIDKAAALGKPVIFAIGNAPTALVRIYELVKEGRLHPALVIGVPVGFVNVVQAKELILELEDVPYIVAKGRKGGSPIAATIINALLYMLRDEDAAAAKAVEK